MQQNIMKVVENNKVTFHILICKISKICLEGYTKTISIDYYAEREVE